MNSGGVIIFADHIGSTIVRGGVNSIKSDLLENSVDGFLYIVYYTQKDQDYINKNTATIISGKKFKFDKYSIKKLDSLNWTITYNGK